MKNKKLLYVCTVVLSIAVGTAYALGKNPRATEIVTFNAGHTHNGDVTHGAPEHSGGTDKYGCHNASVPYHCH